MLTVISLCSWNYRILLTFFSFLFLWSFIFNLCICNYRTSSNWSFPVSNGIQLFRDNRPTLQFMHLECFQKRKLWLPAAPETKDSPFSWNQRPETWPELWHQNPFRGERSFMQEYPGLKPLTTNGQIPKSSNVSTYSALNPEPRRQIWAFSSFHRVQRKKYINIKYTSSFLVCLIFLYVFGFCCCPAFILWEQLSTSLLTYLGLLTPLLAPGWEYDPRVVIESTDAPGRREGPKPEKWART